MKPALHGEIPLHLAAESGSELKVKMLMAMFTKIYQQDNCGLTALFYAVSADRPKVTDLLIRLGADPDDKDFDGNSPIHHAAMHNSIDCVRVLFNNKANLNAKNAMGRTALHYAAEAGYTELVTELLNKGADPNIRDINGWASLRLAIKEKREKIVQILQEHGTRPY